MATPAAPDKRLVFRHETGRLAGILQILGCVSQLPVTDVNGYPPMLQLSRAGDPDKVQANHAGTKTRHVLYREWTQTDSGRLNDYHPEQV